MANPMTPMPTPQLNAYVQNLMAQGNQGLQQQQSSFPSDGSTSLTPFDAVQNAIKAATAGANAVTQALSMQNLGGSIGANFGSANRAQLVDAIAHAIRDHESGGNYNAYNSAGGARGAYQFINSTWNNLAKEFGRNAGDWSSANQDYIAKAYINQILGQYGQDPGNVAQIWYTGHISPNTNYVPSPGAGNTQTVQSYIDYLRNQTNKYLG